MSLKKIASDLEAHARFNGVEIFIDYSVEDENSFIPIINEQGIVGAIGNYCLDSKFKTGYFILNESVVRYALNEGFDKEEIFNCFKDSLFKEMSKKEFFKIMTEKKY